MAHLFYQSGNLITLKIGDHYRSTFRSTKHIFAESSNDSARKLELLGNLRTSLQLCENPRNT